jgi:hypothetical protein
VEAGRCLVVGWVSRFSNSELELYAVIFGCGSIG